MKAITKCCAAAIVVALIAAAAKGLINPDFTPIDLVRQSGVILVLVDGQANENWITMAVNRALKGEAPDEIRINLAPLEKRLRDDLAALLTKDKTLIFIAEERNAANLHVDGRWFQLEPDENETWNAIREDTAMAGLLATWRGGTDMLTRAVEYIIGYPEEAAAPVEGGFGFMEAAEIGHVPGDVSDIYPLVFSKDSPTHLFIASPDGDLLIRGGDFPEDITEEAGLTSRSRAAAWGDFSGNGRLDLASFDGKALSLWLRGEDGSFARRPAGQELAESTHTLVAINIGGEERADLMAAHDDGFVLLRNTGAGFDIAVRFDAPEDMRAELGEAGGAVVADLTGDGRIDLLQPYENGGLLYRGSGDDNRFAAPESSNVAAGVGRARGALGDLDADGRLDILLTSLAGVRIYHNSGAGQFVERREYAGEASYKTQRFASSGAIGDPNADGRDDLLITYHRETVQFYFNRGFMSFGHADAQSNDMQQFVETRAGQRAGVFADLAGDGADDVVLVLLDGSVWYAWNELGEDMPLNLQVHVPGASGPLSVECRMTSRSLGRKVASPGRPARFSVPEPGEYTLEWRRPGEDPVTRNVLVIAEPVKVSIEENE